MAAESADTGKPQQQARELDVARAVANFRVFADTVAAAGLPSFLTELPDGRRALNYAVRKPLGVVAVIVPWNLPLLLLTWKVAPALACGNTVVVKPSEETPSTATLLAEVCAEAGVPAGVYNVVHGFGPDSAGEFLVSHPGIDGVTFTGSSATGAGIMAAVAPRVKPVSFELGGKNAAIVFADADLDDDARRPRPDRSSPTPARSACAPSGCTSSDRSSTRSPTGLTQRARDLRLGRPADPATTTGPLISAEHREKVLAYYRLAEEIGAKILVGGGIPELGAELAGGWWIEPTLWTGLTNADRPLREEIFGPVAALVPFDTEEEAVALANDTDYGLAVLGVDHRPVARPPGRPADARRHVVGQHLVPARSALAVRRRGPVRNRPRGRGFLARVLHRADERLRAAVTRARTLPDKATAARAAFPHVRLARQDSPTSAARARRRPDNTIAGADGRCAGHGHAWISGHRPAP